MATKTFLTEAQLDEARVLLKPPKSPPDGNEKTADAFSCYSFSRWLGLNLENLLQSHSEWPGAGPVAVGSWARGELCPRSDFDLIFCGREDEVRRLVDSLHARGLKIRYRMPEDLSDWTVGVEPFDVLALLQAKAFTPEAAARLNEQQQKIRARGSGFRRKLLKAMTEERAARAARHDSISNYLEPNLKYGPGGLRDLQQAQAVYELFPEKFEDRGHALEVLDYYKGFFLTVRQRLHLNGAGDILAAPEQEALARWLGFDSTAAFMREIQKGLSRVSFYADWSVEQAKAGARRQKLTQSRKLRSATDLFQALKFDPSVLMQNRVRLAADGIFARQAAKAAGKKLGREIDSFIDARSPDAWVTALFRARLIDHAIPEIRRLVGLVQHDQYHRYTADAHLLQALREVKRVFRKPKTLGALGEVARKLGSADWRILSWSALYHDLAKGRGGDHSLNGGEMAAVDLAAFGLPSKIVDEVVWIVENHLLLSQAAFRRNPRSPKTWQDLHDRGVVGRRLSRLAVFTAIDIRATNPEAWTPWKERLIFDLVQVLSSSETSSFWKLLDAAKKLKVDVSREFLQGLDPFLVEAVPAREILNDYRRLRESASGSRAALEPLVIAKKGETWLRLHAAEDRPGLFYRYVAALFRLGFSVNHASVQTFSDYGAYDWFAIKSGRAPSQIKKLLAFAETESREARVPSVKFDRVELVADDADEWILSFRGKDQAGALVAAAKALFDQGLSVKWAKVHTWGRQIDDVIAVQKPGRDPGECLEALRSALTAR